MLLGSICAVVMAESEQKTVGNEPEPQHFSEEAPEQENSKLNKDEQEPSIVTDGSEKENSVVCESEKENINGDEPQNQIVNGNESEKKNSEDELEQNIPAVGAGQNDALNESEHGMLEKASDQDLAVKEQSEVGAENTHDEVKQETNSSVNSEGEKKWPGWPGESVFRMLVPAQKVGNIIGRKGESIKKIVEETRARIKILDGPPGTSERAVMVSAKEEPDAPVPPALDGLLRVHKRIVDGLEGDGTHPPPAAGGKVSTRMLVPATQAGILIGKQGATVKTVQEASNCIVRILSTDLPIFALQDDRVVEVVGEPAGVHKGVELIALHLRKFLVDRSIIQLFESQMQSPSTHMDHMPPQPSWGPPHGLPPSAGGDLGFGPTSQYMPQPRQFDNYYPSADMLPPPQRPPHQGISAYGREPPMSNHASANPQPASTMISQVTQHMQIPLQYADTVIGTSGSTISYIRRSSGATVTIQESRGAPGEMTVEISGTASQVQAAQQLIQNSMAGAGAPTQTQAGGMVDQAYNQGYGSYAATPGTTYGSPATSTGYASQPGSYGSVYGGHGGYGY